MAATLLAVTQMPCAPDRETNIAAARYLVRRAAASEAQIILLHKLFETQYLCL